MSQPLNFKDRTKVQFHFVVILTFNLLYNLIPFFALKKTFLKLFGIKIGRESYVHIPVKFFSVRDLDIGDNSTINPHCYLYARKKISIGNNVNIASNAKIYTLGHDIDSPDLPEVGAEVVIGDDVFIFSNAIIMPGVRVGQGAVVYPGSVVVKDVAPYTVVGGNPARYIRDRKKQEFDKSNYGFWFAQ